MVRIGALLRAVGDVSMDADPYTGVYVAFTSPTARQTSWYVFGGTSLATPMWAAAATVANATRVANAYASLSAPHALLYGTLASGSYLADFNDVTIGSNGTCASCYASPSYDTPTGLGTPKAGSLLTYLGTTP